MSIGNTKEYGNKGNNFPWQYKMLVGLDAILSALSVLKAIPLPMPSSIVIPPWTIWKHVWPMRKWVTYNVRPNRYNYPYETKTF